MHLQENVSDKFCGFETKKIIFYSGYSIIKNRNCLLQGILKMYKLKGESFNESEFKSTNAERKSA